MSKSKSPFGDGGVGKKIAKSIGKRQIK